MQCPLCTHLMESVSTRHIDAGSTRVLVDYACPCGLAGPAEAIEAIARLKSPEHVLAEAERLLRDAHIYSVDMATDVTVFAFLAKKASQADTTAPSLAEAYAKLMEARRAASK